MPDGIPRKRPHMANPSLLILPGDGIGPEVMDQVKRVIDWFGAKRGLAFDVETDLVGGAAFDAHGTPLADSTIEKAQAVDTVEVTSTVPGQPGNSPLQ